jgi:hypothetical protein
MQMEMSIMREPLIDVEAASMTVETAAMMRDSMKTTKMEGRGSIRSNLISSDTLNNLRTYTTRKQRRSALGGT